MSTTRFTGRPHSAPSSSLLFYAVDTTDRNDRQTDKRHGCRCPDSIPMNIRGGESSLVAQWKEIIYTTPAGGGSSPRLTAAAASTLIHHDPLFELDKFRTCRTSNLHLIAIRCHGSSIEMARSPFLLLRAADGGCGGSSSSILGHNGMERTAEQQRHHDSSNRASRDAQ